MRIENKDDSYALLLLLLVILGWVCLPPKRDHNKAAPLQEAILKNDSTYCCDSLHSFSNKENTSVDSFLFEKHSDICIFDSLHNIAEANDEYASPREKLMIAWYQTRVFRLHSGMIGTQ